MPSVAIKITERRARQVQAGPTPTLPLTPQSKTHYRSPTHAGIGINIPSPYIPLTGVEGKFFKGNEIDLRNPMAKSTEVNRYQTGHRLIKDLGCGQ